VCRVMGNIKSPDCKICKMNNKAVVECDPECEHQVLRGILIRTVYCLIDYIMLHDVCMMKYLKLVRQSNKLV
jgi:hypothetical protein